MGLLSKASSLELSNKLAFSTFINLNKIKTCALFEYKNNNYIIQNSIGFDCFSLNASKSTKDFWDGICKEDNKIYSFSKEDNSIECLQQFFSYKMNENLNFIDIYRTNQKILVLLNEKITKKILSDFSKISVNYSNFDTKRLPSLQASQNYYLIQINFLKALESYDEDIEIKTALKNELANRILCYYTEENYAIRINENTVNLFFIEDLKFNEQLFSKHIILNLQEILEINTENIDIIFVKQTTKINELLTFMKVE